MSLGKWAPNSYCHFHKHLGNTTSLVLEGEHHTVETLGGESIHKVRQAGDHAQNPGGDVHMEFAAPGVRWCSSACRPWMANCSRCWAGRSAY